VIVESCAKLHTNIRYLSQSDRYFICYRLIDKKRSAAVADIADRTALSPVA